MNWSNVKLVLLREVRDQLRDRRTLFMIAVLPVLLYPLLGMSMFQVTQFVSEHATRVEVVGADQLPDSPRLLEGNQFATGLFSEPGKAKLLEVTVVDPESEPADSTAGQEQGDEGKSNDERCARRAVQQGACDAVVVFPA